MHARVVGLCAFLLVTACQREQRLFRVSPGDARQRIPEDNADAVAEGQRLFAGFNCVGCHAQGGGGIGPALIDDEWIHGGQPEDIFTVISEGTPNGMPAFRARLPPAQRWQLVAYVRSLSGLVPAAAVPARTDHLQAKTSAPPRQLPADRDLRELRASEDEALHAYGWVDRRAGIVRIPIDRAIELVAGRRLRRPTQPESERRR